MKRISFLIIIVCQFLMTSGQSFNIGAKIGYGFYSLTDMKDIQIDLLSYTGLPAKAVETFPAYLQYSFECNYQINKKQLGITILYYSTGARNHLSDYSGEYKLDMILSSYRIGLHYKSQFFEFDTYKSKFKLYYQLETGMMFSKLKINELFEIYQVDSSYNNSNYNSKSFFIEPSFGFNIPFKNRFFIDCNIGYEFDFAQKLHDSNRNIWLTKRNYDEALLNFRGFRIRIGLFFEI